MSSASYEKQHLVIHAAGFISADGSTKIGFGCLMTRFNTGHYGMLLDANSGVSDGQSFATVITKGSAYRAPCVENVSDFRKDIFVYPPNDENIADADVEIILFRAIAVS